MEITSTSPTSLKLKGKHASLLINPHDKSAQVNAAIVLGNIPSQDIKVKEDVVVFKGPGEYEAGGIKVTGIKGDISTVFSINIDGVDIAVGNLSDLEKLHQKMKEHNIALILANEVHDASFATSIASNTIAFFGTQAKTVADSFAKDEKKEVSKYQITAEKLPTEVETILLASS